MEIHTSVIAGVAKLAKLTLPTKKLESLTTELTGILEYLGSLRDVDTRNVEPLSQTTGLTDITREDAIDTTRILPRDGILTSAKGEHNGFFKAPFVFSKDQE